MSREESADDAAARIARAKRIQERIDDIVDAAESEDSAPGRGPQNPREFTDQQAAEERREADDE